MSTLTSALRKKLENSIIQAREIAEQGARLALEALAVHESRPYDHMNEEQRRLRTHLRARGRQLGDAPDARDLRHLIGECAYEHWHRMLFARFLAENHLLIHPEMGVAVTLEECEELAKEGRTDKWRLASLLAQHMLPQIFRPDDPVLQVTLPREYQIRLEQLLNSLESDIFLSSDAIGWVYQFWQTRRKDEVNDSGDSGAKVGADELAAVTQLFTEDYMVDFMLDNTLGAWLCARRTAGTVKPETPGSADQTSVGGDSFLRLKEDGTPMAGAYAGWPRTAAELKCLDPCCGSGHFLVALFERLAPLRMAEEGLDAAEAARAVLRDNIHGLEIDPRCTQLAAFNLALAAWKFAPEAVLQPLPRLQIACCGLEIGVSEAEWRALAPEQGFLMKQLYELFNNAVTYGSLIDPQRQIQSGLNRKGLGSLEEAIEKGLAAAEGQDYQFEELGVTAQGLTAAYRILNSRFHLVATNVPYLARGKQEETLRRFIETHYAAGKQDLATAFVERCREFCAPGGTAVLVTPQNWLFLGSYKKLREILLKGMQWDWVAKLGPKGFRTPMWDFNVMLLSLTRQEPDEQHHLAGLDVSAAKTVEEKARRLAADAPLFVSQSEQLGNPDGRVVLEESGSLELLGKFTKSYKGITSGDDPHYRRFYWENLILEEGWKYLQSTVDETMYYGGCQNTQWYEAMTKPLQPGVYIRAWETLGKYGIMVSQMRLLPISLSLGETFDTNAGLILSNNIAHLPAIWCYCTSLQYNQEVRKIDQKLNVTNATLVKVPFDLEYWQKVAAEKYPNGLPEPYSNDPTQWLFHGHPALRVAEAEIVAGASSSGAGAGSSSQLQIAVARLMGFRWPAERDAEMRLSTESRALVARCQELLPLADEDGIACIPSVRGEEPAAARLRLMLQKAFGEEWNERSESALLKAGGSTAPDLDAWLRDEFFEGHCRLFHHRPFIWHIWDGRRRDGFHALVNYHRLAEGEGRGRKLLENLTYSYLGDWINRQKEGVRRGEGGAEDRLAASLELQSRLIKIIAGESPFDIFVRWKPLSQQAIGWAPDINDGVRLNIRPFLADDLPNGRKGCGILRWRPNVKWDKDRGQEPLRSEEEYPWFWHNGRFLGHRVNDIHLTIERKHQARANHGK